VLQSVNSVGNGSLLLALTVTPANELHAGVSTKHLANSVKALRQAVFEHDEELTAGQFFLQVI